MNTRVIYASKETTQINNPDTGEWVNNISQGIQVKKGDRISIEGITINSIGVGSDIIEVPEDLQEYDYLTNRMIMNAAFYIHHNRRFTCPLPFTDTTVKFTTITDNNYGYVRNTGIKQSGLDSYEGKNPFGNNTCGKRFYIGGYMPIYDNTTNKFLKTEGIGFGPDAYANGEASIVPGGIVGTAPDTTEVGFEFMRTNIPFGVKTGYDNPSSIAQKITEDFHSADIFPDAAVLNSQPVNSFPAQNNSNTTVQFSQFTCSTRNSSVNLIDTTGIVNPTLSNGYYGAYVGYSNPFYHYYGSRLCLPSSQKNTEWILGYGSNNPPHSNDVYNIFKQDLNPAGTATLMPQSAVIGTNLAYNERNLKLIAEFIHSQKAYNGTASTTAELDSDLKKEFFTTKLKFGRGDDTAADETVPLMPPPYAQAANTLPDPNSALNKVPVSSFFRADVWDKKVLPTDAVANGVKLTDDIIVNIDGRPLNVKQVAKYLDVNICCINPVPPGSSTPPETDYNIGIVSNGKEFPTGTIIYPFNYLIDLTFFNTDCPAVFIVNPFPRKNTANPPTSADFINLLNVGSPNINMVWDPARGRFGFANMSWALIADNGTETNPVPGAGQEIIGINRQLNAYGSPSTGQQNPFLAYAQSGLGILNFSVIPKDGDLDDINNAVEINYNDPDDITAKWDNSILARLGFTYKGILNKNGMADVIFSVRHINQVLPFDFPTYFPYPMTTNALMDTSLDINLGVNQNSLPMFDLRQERNFENINVDCETAALYATQLPKKLEFPYWLVKSDLINGVDFYSQNNGAVANIMGICNRAYLAGDFAFSMGSDYVFVATKDYVITSVKTQILNPDLTPAEVDNKTAVIYKIQSPLLNISYASAGGTLYPPPEPPKHNDITKEGEDNRKEIKK